MKARRKRSDPQATRYRIAVTALAKAEKRQAAAERAVAELRRKVRGYERRLPPERVAEIEGGTRTAKVIAKARKDTWKEAGATLRAAWAMSGDGELACPLLTLRHPPMPGKTVGRIYGMAVRLRENHALIVAGREAAARGPARPSHGRGCRGLSAVSRRWVREPWPEFSTSYPHNPIAYVDLAIAQAAAVESIIDFWEVDR